MTITGKRLSALALVLLATFSTVSDGWDGPSCSVQAEVVH